MRRYEGVDVGERGIFVGIDVHRHQWHVTVIVGDEEVLSRSIQGDWDSLRKLLSQYRGSRVSAAYEAGYFGYSLCDNLVRWGADCLVTPPSLLPMEYGNRVKTDRRDSRKLAFLLSKGMLKRVWVPSIEDRYHRQVFRRRCQLVKDRVRVQNRIKSELRFYGIPLPYSTKRWTGEFVSNLLRLRFNDDYMQESFNRLLGEYEYLSSEIKAQTALLKKLSQTEKYRDRVEILCSIPGIGLLSAMEILLELGEIERFRRAEQLPAYVGVTPAQYSSGDKVRMGRITCIGKSHLRGTLVEVAWVAINRNRVLRKKFDEIKRRSGSKRAVVAIARRLVLCLRRMLLDSTPYRIVEAA